MNTKLAFCIPAYGTINSLFLTNSINFISWCEKNGYDVEVFINNLQPCDKARNDLIDTALAANPDYIFFLDSDNLVQESTIPKLRKVLEDDPKCMVATALYFEKGKPYYPVIRGYSLGGFWKIENVKYGQVIEVAGAGMGCALIKPELFKKIQRPYYKFNYEQWLGKEIQLSEDLYFSRQVFQAGYTIKCHTGVISGHIGGGVDAWEFESFRKIRQDISDEREEYLNDIAEYTKDTYDGAKEKMYTGPRLIAKEWNEKNPKTKEEVDRFYKETINYLYDLGVWHFGERRQFDIELLTAITGNIKPKNVLDFGAGIAHNAYMLSKAGVDVTVADLDSKTLDFAEWRFNKHNVKAKFWRTDKEPAPSEKFDVILCFDVLEHIPKEDLKGVVERLLSLKAEHGRVILTTNFGKSESHPMHYDADEEVEKLMSKLVE